ncbi:MAG: aspartate kinase, partial [Clostridiales bacterium]|nr:aspartate kinase [Clostridiales bacterium]
MLTVMKFGGSSVANAEKIRHAASIIEKAYNKGESLVVVLSAQGKTTDMLKEKALELNKRPSKREIDMLLSTGEQQSVALMAICLGNMGLPAVSLNAAQVGIETDTAHGQARILRIDRERIRAELDNRRIVIVTGFQGIDRNDDITTLGRGGSDTTAVSLAAVLHADTCKIFTDVEGVFTADPRIVEKPIKLREIGYDEMLELSSLGTQVLMKRSVEMAKRYDVQLEVLSAEGNKPGTIVREVKRRMEEMKISGIAKDNNVARIAVVGVPDEPGIAFRVFNAMARAGINVDIILQSYGKDNTNDISFTVAIEDSEPAAEALSELQ